MSRRIVIGASAGAIMVAGIAVAYATALAAQRGGKAAAQRHGVGAEFIPPAWRLARDPSKVYTVEPMPVRGEVKPRTQQEERLLEQATEIVARLRPVPEARLQFFSWIDQADSPLTVTGWGVFVQQVTPTPEGWLITLQVTPSTTRKDGGKANVGNCFIEQYLWSDGTLRYMNGFAHPKIGAEPFISTI